MDSSFHVSQHFWISAGFPRAVLHDGRGVLQQGQDAASRIGWRTSQQEGKGWARAQGRRKKGLKKTTERHRKTTYLNIWIYLTVFESFEEFFSWLNLMCSNFFAHLFGLSRWKCPKLQDHYQMLWLVVWDQLWRSCFFGTIFCTRKKVWSDSERTSGESCHFVAECKT